MGTMDWSVLIPATLLGVSPLLLIQNNYKLPEDLMNIINRISLIQLQDKVPSLTEKLFEKFLEERLQRACLKKVPGFLNRELQ